MTELFKGGKKYCECCSAFITNNPVSLKKHFSGNRHKRNLQQSIINKRKDKTNKIREERETFKELRQLERVIQYNLIINLKINLKSFI